MNHNEKILDQICDKVAREEYPNLGGLADDGLYEDWAKAVAREYARIMSFEIIEDWSRTIKIPTGVATCASCNTQLTADVDGWRQVSDNSKLFIAESVTPWCKTDVEKCLEMGRNLIQNDYMKVNKAVLTYLNSKYRWKEETNNE